MAEYTNAELLSMWRAAAAALATGLSYSMNGRSLTRANWQEVKDAIRFFQELVDMEGDTTGGIVLGRYDQPR